MGGNPVPNIGFNPLFMMNPHMRMPTPVGMHIPPRMMGPQTMPMSPYIRTPGSGTSGFLFFLEIDKHFINIRGGQPFPNF